MGKESKKLTVLALSGISCSGKTALAEKLKQELTDMGYNVRYIGQDSYFIAGSKCPIASNGYTNWDVPEAINMKEFYNCIHQYIVSFDELQSSKSILLIEGFLFFHDTKFLELIDKLILTYADYQILLSRRNSRAPRQTIEYLYSDPPNYFELIVYPSYLKYYKLIHESVELSRKSINVAQFTIQHQNRNIFCLDSGKLSQQEMLESTIKYIFN